MAKQNTSASSPRALIRYPRGLKSPSPHVTPQGHSTKRNPRGDVKKLPSLSPAQFGSSPPDKECVFWLCFFRFVGPLSGAGGPRTRNCGEGGSQGEAEAEQSGADGNTRVSEWAWGRETCRGRRYSANSPPLIAASATAGLRCGGDERPETCTLTGYSHGGTSKATPQRAPNLSLSPSLLLSLSLSLSLSVAVPSTDKSTNLWCHSWRLQANEKVYKYITIVCYECMVTDKSDLKPAHSKGRVGVRLGVGGG